LIIVLGDAACTIAQLLIIYIFKQLIELDSLEDSTIDSQNTTSLFTTSEKPSRSTTHSAGSI